MSTLKHRGENVKDFGAHPVGDLDAPFYVGWVQQAYELAGLPTSQILPAEEGSGVDQAFRRAKRRR